MTRPHLFAVSEYDDGAYFGSAVRLVHGAVPYRDFILVQPPGITVLLLPAALLSKATGTAAGLVIGRILNVLASTASVVLAGLLVRHRGLLAVLVSCGTLAIYPDSVAAAHSILLEPWLVLACLAGALAVFDSDRLADSRRLAWGGAAFGFASSIKVWAVIPVVVIGALCLFSPGNAVSRVRRAAVFAGGVGAGFAIPVLPFAALAPQRFYQSVVTAQFNRVSIRIPVWHRLQDMIGILQPQTWSHQGVLVIALIIAAAVIGAHIAAAFAAHRPPPPLDLFAVVTVTLVVLVFLWPTYFAGHYTAFLGPFLGLAFALPTARIVTAVANRRQPGTRLPGPGLRWLATGLASVAVLVAALVLAANSPGPASRLPSASLERAIPAGACVLSDQVSYLLLANRFVSGVPGCPQMVDSLGTDLALSGGRVPATGADRVPALLAVWRSAFAHAQYVLLSRKNTNRIPWTTGLRAYFSHHFTRIVKARAYAVYARR